MTAPFIHSGFPLILASASPRRRRLLEQAGLPFHATPAGIPEEPCGRDPDRSACVISGQKAEAVFPGFRGQWILGADTIVWTAGTALGKPENEDDAHSMLQRLSGREHRVVTGFTVMNPCGGLAHQEAVSTAVRFRSLERSEIEGYIATGEPFGKAGAYAIQGMGAFMVESISGSYTNVVGLPLCAVIQALLRAGALARFPLPARGTRLQGGAS